MAALKIGVIIGRFQVPTLHEGHLRLFAEVGNASDRVVVLLGVSPTDGYTAENPLTFAQRSAMLLASDISPFKGLVTLPLFDQRTNEEWSTQLDILLKGAYPTDDITLYGGRDSFVESYKGKLKVQRSTFCPVIPATGTLNRAAIKEANSPDFYAGQIFALQRQFPRCFPTVDVAVTRPGANGSDVLLIQRADNGHWCFPGGFVDPTDESFERAACRELYEEVGLSIERREMHYVGTFPINDFRYRGSRDKIITTFFRAQYAFGPVILNPNEVQDYKWAPFTDVTGFISPIHQHLFDALRKSL